jgi:hypothetical protein
MLVGVDLRRAIQLATYRARAPLTAAGVPPATPGYPGRGLGVASPWATSQLSQIVWADILGSETLPVTRAEAVTVPSVTAARKILVSRISGLPLVALDAGGPLATQPSFLYRTNGVTTPWHRMAWTIDDLLFYGWSLWEVVRGTDAAILDAVRVPPEWWQIDPDNRITINSVPVAADDVILFPGPDEGLCTFACRTIRAAKNVESAWAGRVRNPVPIVDLHRTTDNEMDPDEVADMLDAFTAARRDVNGAVTSTPSDVELHVFGETAGSYLVEARNAVRLDIANMTGLPAASLDGSLSTASLTYSTQEGARTELADALQGWTDPIEARLSQDDVVPRGTRVRFDVSDLATPVPTPTGIPVED